MIEVLVDESTIEVVIAGGSFIDVVLDVVEGPRKLTK